MKSLTLKAVLRCLVVFWGLAALLFIPAWTVRYWQAWNFLAVFTLSILALTLFLASKNPQLLERRLKARAGSEKRTRQKILHFLMSKALALAVVLPAIDHRYSWSAVPPYMVVAGDVLIALGFLIVLFVFNENTFALGTVEIQNQQTTISTGPYAIVRHPMYSGLLITFLGMPLALGSWWGLLILLPFIFVTVARLVDEETLLVKTLPGYSDYVDAVRYRLVPLIW